MDIRHKKKAIIGLAIWIVAMLLAGVSLVACSKLGRQAENDSLRTKLIVLFVVFLFIQCIAYFWGGSHLAKAKGYSNGIISFGIIIPAQLIVLAILLFGLPDKCPHHSGTRSKRKHSADESTIGRIVRYRRNAFVANCFGLGGIVVALIFFFFPAGLFRTWGDARLAAILVFVPSYAAVIYGCWWWVRAKFWSQAVIIIGLLPVILPFIRGVNLIFRAAPMLLPFGMIIMPVVLLGVVAVLPDKSGMPKRKQWDRD